MERNIIQMTSISRFGRFGNQIFQYLFARAYAERYDAVLEIPPWVGEKIFKNVSHTRPSRVLPTTAIDSVNCGTVNIDLVGYFQKKEFLSFLQADVVRTWLQVQERWLDRFQEPQFELVAHHRLGDYHRADLNIFCVLPQSSYVRACARYNLDVNKLVWVTEETQNFDSALEKDLQFLPDFFAMINAKTLLRGNSTFSFWAGFFNNGDVYSPVVKQKTGYPEFVEFVKGNTSSIATCNDDFIF